MRVICRHIATFVLLVMQSAAFSQDLKIELNATGQGSRVMEEEPGRIRISSSVPLVRVSREVIRQDTFTRIHAEGYTPGYRPGAPELPVCNLLVEYPPDSSPGIRIISWKEDTVKLADYGISSLLIPSRLSPSKTTSPDSMPPVIDEAAYRSSVYETGEPVRFTPLGISRGTGVGMITLSPFRYYPEENRLTLLNDLVFEITWPVSSETAYKSAKSRFQSDIFNRSLRTLVYSSAPVTLPVSSGKPVKYVILSDTMFRDCLQPLVQWKTRKGFEVIELYRGEPGVGETREEMKTALKALYDSATAEDPAPLFLLIAGDVEQIPSSQSSGQLTDLYYAEYDGNGDYLPELFYGRFSAADTAEMRVLVEKTLQHEQYLFPDPAFLDATILIAGVDGQYAPEWGNGQINYMNRYYFNREHGNIVHKYLYPASGELADSIRADIGRGASLVNYTGHGYPDRWDNPRFSKSDIPGMQNEDKYPVMIGNGCSTATFDEPECLAEALVRAENKGALAYIGCTNDSYWDEDFYWAVGVGPVTADPLFEETGPGVFDRLYHENGEPPEEWYPALGQALYAGNLAVMAGNIDRAKYYWEIYHLLGDPSLVPYFSVPEPMPARHASFIHGSSEHLSVLTEPRVYGAISSEGDLLEARYTDGAGSLVFDLPGDMQGPDTILLTLTGQNRQPYCAGIVILPDSVPYPELLSVTVLDPDGTQNGRTDHGDTISLSFELANRGTHPSDSLSFKLISDDPVVELLDSTGITGPANPQSTFRTPALFSILLADSVKNGYSVSFMLEIRDRENHSWEHYFRVEIKAPDLATAGYSVDDRRHGNGNGRLDPGERAQLRLGIVNRGGCESDSVTAALEPQTGKLGINASMLNAGVILPNITNELSFGLSADPSLARGSWLKIPVRISSPPYEVNDTIDLPVGMIVEDFESGNLRMYPWENDSIIPWKTDPGSVHGGLFSARPGSCGDSDTAVLAIRAASTADDSISFYFRVSSEAGYDYLRFFMDGTQIDSWSGELYWQRFACPVTAGEHSFRWMYTKDEALSRGADAAWIDFIEFPEGSFTRYDPGMLDILSPKPGQPLPLEDPVKIRVKNFGSSVVDDLPVTYTVNDTLVRRDTLFGTLQSYDSLEYTFALPVQLARGHTYLMKVFTDYGADEYRGNDTLSVIFPDDTFADAGISGIIYPEASDSVFTDSETVTIRVLNEGNQALSQIPVTLVTDGSITAQEIIPGNLSPSDSLLYTFLSGADLSAYGFHELLVFATYPGDGIHENDSIRQEFEHKQASSIRSVQTAPGGLSVFPNPAPGKFRIRIAYANRGDIIILVRNAQGKLIRKTVVRHSGGEFSATLDLEGFPGGLYFVELMSGDRMYSGHLINFPLSR